MARLARSGAQALVFAVCAVPIAFALAYLEVYLLGHVSDAHPPEWHLKLATWTKLFALVLAAPIFLLGALVKNAEQRGWSGLPQAAISGIAYFVPLTLIGMLTWQRPGIASTGLLVLMFAHIFFGPFLFGRWVGATRVG